MISSEISSRVGGEQKKSKIIMFFSSSRLEGGKSDYLIKNICTIMVTRARKRSYAVFSEYESQETEAILT